MKVAFIGRGLHVASTRYRIVIPAMQLQRLGHEITKDAPIIVFNKSGVSQEVLDLYEKKIYDVCDDNFDCPMRGPEYRRYIEEANAVTVNSECMRFIVHQKTGRVATVIPDPYEHPEWEPSWGEGLLWFGHWTNLKDLDRTGLKATVLTDARNVPPGHTAEILARTPHELWTHEAMDKALKSHAIVVIPTGRAIAKSANRLIESVMAGKFVVAEPLPAYEEFSGLMWVGDMKAGVEWAQGHRDECLERVKACQAYIKKKFSPERIGLMWERLLSSI